MCHEGPVFYHCLGIEGQMQIVEKSMRINDFIFDKGST